MTVYVVRCNFSEPSLEEDWNNWYNREHANRLLSVPGFNSVTRYRAVGLDEAVKYMAIWDIDDPSVMTSEGYRAVRGGRFPDRWEPHITDWSRSIFEAIYHERADHEPDH